MHTKLVSVVIPSYNHEKFIKSTISSIIEQTYPNIELIVIDDDKLRLNIETEENSND